MKLDQRVRQLARHRAQLVRRSSLQRESLQLQWHQGTAPLRHSGEFIDRCRSMLASAGIPLSAVTAAVALPLGWLLIRIARRKGRSLGAVVRLALAAWPLIRSVRNLLAR
jgi:hypothetical protein